MSTSPQNNLDNQEIDLSQLSKKIENAFESVLTSIFNVILFFKRNIIVLGILFFIGIGLGIYLDKNTKIYDNQIIITPNFGSTDYLYAKIDLINSKIIEGDSLFLKNEIGILEPNKFKAIEIEPITDVYKFIENKEQNFELIKLMAEDGDIKKIVEDNMTSKNYPYHKISFKTDRLTSDKKIVQPLLNYLNKSEYYSKLQNEIIKNVKVKMIQNDTIISQINGFLNSFSSKVNGSQKSDKLVYYNENSQLNEVIKTKDALILEQGSRRIELLNNDKIIKDISTTINVKNTKALNGKMKLILPFIFIFLFICSSIVKSFYKRQSIKSKN